MAAEQDKRTHFTLTHRIPRQDLPSLTFRAVDAETVRYFPDKLPIAIDADGRTHVLLYLLRQELPIDFRGFLERYAELRTALPAGPGGSWCRVTSRTRCRATRQTFASSSRRRSGRVCWRTCSGTFIRRPRLRRASLPSRLSRGGTGRTGPGCHLVDDVG